MLDNLDKTYIMSRNGEGKIPCYLAKDNERDIFNLVENSKDEINEQLLKHGGILLRGFDIRAVSQFNKLANIVSPNLLDYVNRSTPRTKLGGKVYTATEYPADRYIPFHNENSYTLSWPDKILFFAVVAPEEGGETAIADSRYVYQKIDKNIIKEFNDKKVLYTRNFHQGIDLSWQEVFQVDTKNEVEEYCKKNAINYEWREGSFELTTKQICQATIKHAVTNEDVWFNQAHLFHVSSLDKDSRTKLLDLVGNNLPRNSSYGDGSEIEEKYFESIRKAYEQERIEFRWQKGDVMILDNILMAHSRNPFKGDRKIVVAMGS
jgi:alpha-ketoglutarate-dependent taurine dioxygenase